MTVVTITLDDSSGAVEMGCLIPGGWKADSQACQMANMLVNYMDSIAAPSDFKAVALDVEPPASRIVLIGADPAKEMTVVPR